MSGKGIGTFTVINQVSHLAKMPIHSGFEVLLGATDVVVPVMACSFVYQDGASALSFEDALAILAQFLATIARTVLKIFGYDVLNQFGS